MPEGLGDKGMAEAVDTTASITFTKKRQPPRTQSHVLPSLKKGNLKQCQNYRTISLISHYSKIMLQVILSWHSVWMLHTFHPQWGAADAEIKVPSGDNTELNVLPLKPGVGQYIAIHATLIARDFFLALRSIHLHFFQTSSDFFCVSFG